MFKYSCFLDFEEIYPDIVQKVKECDFCSIDCELSGITQFKDLNSFDTPKSRFDKMKKVFKIEFLLLKISINL